LDRDRGDSIDRPKMLSTASSELIATETKEQICSEAGPRAKTVLELRLDNEKICDIAKKLEIDESTVRRNLRRLQAIASRLGASVSSST
jgi:hypothetical protein